jgi:transposase
LRIEADQLPELARLAPYSLEAQLAAISAQVDDLERRIVAQHRENETRRRLATISGIGPITASAVAASPLDPTLFWSGRQFAAWLGPLSFTEVTSKCEVGPEIYSEHQNNARSAKSSRSG